MINDKVEFNKPLTDEDLKIGRNGAKNFYEDKNLNDYQKNRVKDELHFAANNSTQFDYIEKDGELLLTIHTKPLNILLHINVSMTPHDEIAILNYINKDNNRIKSQIEEMQHLIKTN